MMPGTGRRVGGPTLLRRCAHAACPQTKRVESSDLLPLTQTLALTDLSPRGVPQKVLRWTMSGPFSSYSWLGLGLGLGLRLRLGLGPGLTSLEIHMEGIVGSEPRMEPPSQAACWRPAAASTLGVACDGPRGTSSSHSRSCGEIQGRYGEIWGGMGRSREI